MLVAVGVALVRLAAAEGVTGVARVGDASRERDAAQSANVEVV